MSNNIKEKTMNDEEKLKQVDKIDNRSTKHVLAIMVLFAISLIFAEMGNKIVSVIIAIIIILLSVSWVIDGAKKVHILLSIGQELKDNSDRKKN